MKAMILAAGKGERMRPLTLKTPKPLLCVNGEPMILRHIKKLASIGVKEIIINVHYLADVLMDALGDGARFGVKLIYSDERQYEYDLNTGGGVLNAQHLLGSASFILVSADIVTDFPFERLCDVKLNSAMAHFVLVDNPPFHPEGDFGLKEGVVSLKGSKKLNFAGISLVCGELLRGQALRAVGFADLLRPYIAAGKVTGCYYQGQWDNIGTPEQLAVLNENNLKEQ